MTDPTRTPRRAARRLGTGLGAAVALAVVVPVAAAAVGVDVPDPISVVRASADRRGPECVEPCEAPAATPAAVTSAGATPTPSPTEAAEAAETHGRVVSTVARCAPRGQDPVFAVTGELRTHGDFVGAAAAGHTLALPFGSYDLATLAGAESLCAALAAQRAALPSPTAEPRGSGKARDASAGPRPDRSREPRPGSSPRSRPAKRSASPRPGRTR